MAKKLVRKLVSAFLSLFLVLGSVSLSAPALASSPDLVADNVYAARLLAEVSRQRVLVSELLTENSTTFVNADGSFTTESSSAQVRVRDAAAESGWRDLDFTLVVKPDGSVGPVSGLNSVSLSNGGDLDSVALTGIVQAVDVDGSVIGFGWGSALPIPVLSGNRATYLNVLPGVDIVVEVNSEGFEQFFVVKEKPSAETLAGLNLPLKMRKVKLVPQSDGSFSFLSSGNETVASIPVPRVWDSSVDPMNGSSFAEDFDATYLSDVKTLNLDSVASFFDNPNLVYPVTIDPAMTWTPNSDTYVLSDTGSGYSTSSELLVGTYNGGATKARSFIRFNSAYWMNKQILSSSLKLYENWSYSCNPRAVTIYPATANMSTSTNWSNQPGVSTAASNTVTTAKGYSSSCASGWVTFNSTSVVNYLSKNYLNSQFSTIAVRASESDSYGWKRFHSANGANPPVLSVTYNTPPQTPSSVQVAPGQLVDGVQFATSLTPTFSTLVGDSDKDKVTVTFSLYPDATSTTPLATLCTVSAVVTGTTASCKASNPLADNSTFFVRAKSNDTHIDSALSAVLLVKTAGTAPSQPVIACNGYLNDSNTQTVPSVPIDCLLTQNATSGVSDASKIQLQIDSSDVVEIPVISGSLTYSFTLPAGSRAHVVQATALSAAGLRSTESSYSFSIGDSGIYWPRDVVKTSGTAKISAYVAPSNLSFAGARIDWVTEDNSISGSKTISMSSLQTFKTLKGLFEYQWNTRELFKTAGFAAYANGGVASVSARVCFTYLPASEKCTPYDISLLVVQHAFTATNPTISVGNGTVALLTGEFQQTEVDASQSLPEGALSISRTKLSFDGALPANQAVFGPGWNPSFAGIDSGAVSYTVSDSTKLQGLISLIDADGNPLVFNTPAKIKDFQPVGKYLAAEQETRDTFANLKVDYSGAQKRMQLIEAEGRTTTWLLINANWQLQSVVEPNGLVTNTYSYDASGRVTRILGPVPSGVTCNLNVETSGCRALYVSYATTTTATSTTPGDFLNQVKSISYKAFDSTINAMKITQVATYLYNSNGYLVEAKDPRSNRSTTYTYTQNTLLQNYLVAKVKTSGFAAYNFSYSTNGELLNVTRDKADGSSGQDIETTIVYDIAISGSNLPDLSATNTNIWKQEKSPKYGVAVFGADQTFTNSDLTNQIDLSTLTANQLRTGTYFYTDPNGDTINTAKYGIDSWLYTYTQRDQYARPVVSFDENGISQILDLAASGDLQNQDVTKYATVNRFKDFVYNLAGKQTDGGQLVESWSPTRLMNVDGKQSLYRLHSTITYDDGAPTVKLGEDSVAYGLETSRTVSLTGSAVATETVVAKTLTFYDPIDGASPTSTTSGWILRKPTKIQNLDPAIETAITVASQTQTLYDWLGRTVKVIANGSNGSDSLTDYYAYYSSSANTSIPSCGNKPQWNGLTCFVGTANASNREKPNKQITNYDYYLNPLTVVESATNGTATASRTTNLNYYADNQTASAGKLNTTTITTSFATGSIEPVQNIYDNTNGLLIKTQSTTNPTTQYVSYTYDLWGRKTSTTTKTATTNDTGTLTYLAYGQIGAGQIGAVTTGQNTLIYSYGATDTNGNQELRNLPTGLSVSSIGNYTANYNNAGQITTQTAPGTVDQTFDYDPTGQLIRMAYNSDITTNGITGNVEWFENTRDYDPFGRVKTESTPSLNPATDGDVTTTYTYDANARLVNASDVSDLFCSTRTYSFDTQGNRISKTSAKTIAIPGTCDATMWSTTTRNLTFNKFSQITSAGYVYDALGRNTSLPAVDSPNGTLTTFDFAADNRVVKQSQGTKSWEYTFDVLGRRVSETAKTGTTVNSVTTRHYGNESDNPTWVTSSTQTDVYTPSLGSSLNVIKTVAGSTTTKSLQIANLHGDTITSVVLPATGGVTPPSEVNLFDEYGLPTFTATPNPQDAYQLNYGSLGQAQRQTTDTGITLMGVRGYNPVTGQFLSPDPIQGGNETTYNYPNDPINSRDITGQFDEIGEAISDIVFGGLALYASLELCAGMFICAIGLSGVAGFLSGALNAATNGASFEMIIDAGMRKSADFQAAALITGGIGIGVRKLIQTGKTRLTLSEEIKLDVSIEVGSTVRENALKFGRPGPKTSKQFGGTLATRGWSVV